MRKILLVFAIVTCLLGSCKKCYFCGGNYNGDICSDNPEYKSIKPNSTGQFVYAGIRGTYICNPQ